MRRVESIPGFQTLLYTTRVCRVALVRDEEAWCVVPVLADVASRHVSDPSVQGEPCQWVMSEEINRYIPGVIGVIAHENFARAKENEFKVVAVQVAETIKKLASIWTY